jgi:hypothetical protein
MASYQKKIQLPGKLADGIYDAVAGDIERFLAKSSLGSVDVTKDPAGKKVSFKSSMASGTLSAKDGELFVDISLSFLATPFKSKIDEGIQKWIGKTFGSTTG